MFQKFIQLLFINHWQAGDPSRRILRIPWLAQELCKTEPCRIAISRRDTEFQKTFLFVWAGLFHEL